MRIFLILFLCFGIIACGGDSSSSSIPPVTDNNSNGDDNGGHEDNGDDGGNGDDDIPPPAEEAPNVDSENATLIRPLERLTIASSDQQQDFVIPVPAGYDRFKVAMENIETTFIEGEAWVQDGTGTLHCHFEFPSSAREECVVRDPIPGDWYVSVQAEAITSIMDLTAFYDVRISSEEVTSAPDAPMEIRVNDSLGTSDPRVLIDGDITGEAGDWFLSSWDRLSLISPGLWQFTEVIIHGTGHDNFPLPYRIQAQQQSIDVPDWLYNQNAPAGDGRFHDDEPTVGKACEHFHLANDGNHFLCRLSSDHRRLYRIEFEGPVQGAPEPAPVERINEIEIYAVFVSDYSAAWTDGE